MPKSKSDTAHLRITVGLPNLQDQIRLVNRLRERTEDLEQQRWRDLSDLLSELYTQLQSQRQVTVHRIDGGKSEAKAASSKK